jgi:hypothetical protein
MAQIAATGGAGQPAAPVPAISAASLKPAARPAGRQRGAARRVPGWLPALAAYLAGGAAVWWHAWTGHPTSAMTCACGDPPSFVWFLAWPEYALTHGQGLFFSARSHVPGGINLLANTSVLALGVALLPVTMLAGPVATLNVALTLAPALTALSAYVTLRRAIHLRWLAAFTGGLLFGFSPFEMRNEAVAHLQVSFLALLPLIFWCCYALAVSQQGKWWQWGLALGALIFVQFFIGSEMLAITAMMAGLGLAAAAAAAWARGTLAPRLPFAWRGFGLAAAVAGAALAYPLWFALRGPQHIRGAVWPYPSANGLLRILLPLAQSPFQQAHLPMIGYLGPAGTLGAYLGIPALLAMAAAAVLTHRPLVLLGLGLTAVALWLSLGATSLPVRNGGEPSVLWLPWALFTHIPVVENITPANFSAAAAWFAALSAGALIHHLLHRAGPPITAAAVSGAVAVALVVPWLAAWPLPLRTVHVSLPAWVSRTGEHLPADAAVLFYPFPSSYQDQALVWQAMAGMRFAVAGGRGIVTGPGGTADHGFTPGTAEGTLSALTTSYAPHAVLRLPPLPGPATAAALRATLRRWGVTDVVVTPGGRNPGYAIRWLTAVLGQPPHRQDGAWVWNSAWHREGG